MNLELHKMLGGPSWMARPKKQNGARVEGRTWYSAEQLVALGWDDYCCEERLENLLTGIEEFRPKERGGILFRTTDAAMFTTEFRFPSRQWAKRVREAIAIIYAQQQLEAPPPEPEDGGWRMPVRRCACEYRTFGDRE